MQTFKFVETLCWDISFIIIIYLFS